MFGHGRGAATHVSACLVRARRAAPRQRHVFPFVPYGQSTCLCPHSAMCEGMSRRKHANPHGAGGGFFLGGETGAFVSALVPSLEPAPPESDASPSSPGSRVSSDSFPGDRFAESRTSTSSSSSSSHRSHMSVWNSQAASWSSRSRRATEREHAVSWKSSLRTYTSILGFLDATELPPESDASERVRRLVASSSTLMPMAFRQKHRASPTRMARTESAAKSSGSAGCAHEKHRPVCPAVDGMHARHTECPHGAACGSSNTSSHAGHTSCGDISSTNTTRSRFVEWKNSADVPGTESSFSTMVVHGGPEPGTPVARRRV